VYFLTDDLVVAAAPGDERAKEGAMLRVLRGDLDRSRWLFDAFATPRRLLGVAIDAVGLVVTRCWQHHAHSAVSATRTPGL